MTFSEDTCPWALAHDRGIMTRYVSMGFRPIRFSGNTTVFRVLIEQYDRYDEGRVLSRRIGTESAP